MQRRLPTASKLTVALLLRRSKVSLLAPILLALLLGGCDFWPFGQSRSNAPTQDANPSPFARSASACPTACAMASASKHELTLLLGSEKLPSELEWGRPYVDGAGFQAFSKCIGEETENQERIAECLKEAHDACINACQQEERARVARKKERHHGRDEARRKARQKESVTPKPPASKTPKVPAGKAPEAPAKTP